MNRLRRVPGRMVLLGLSAALAWSQPAAARLNAAQGGLATSQSSASTSANDATDLQQTLQDTYVCQCVERYRDGSEASVGSCDGAMSECADFDLLEACQEDPDGP